MSCCCSSAEEKRPPTKTEKIEFSKFCSSGFEKDKTSIYYSENSVKKTVCERAGQSKSTIPAGYNDPQDSDKDIPDMVFVDGNENDLDVCGDEDTLMERVWWLSKPPYIPCQTLLVSARKIQVVKERLSSTVKGLPTIRAALKEQASKSFQRSMGPKSPDYVIVGKFSPNSQIGCGSSEQTFSPVCAHRISHIF